MRASLALALLPCLALAACTVGSTTDGDTDGGHNTSSSGSTSGSTTSSSGSTTSSSGSTDGGACPQNTSNIILDSVECQNCLNTSCCAETAACFNVKDDSASSKQGCDAYLDCLLKCDDNTDSDSCKGLCKAAAIDAVPGLYDTYLTCRTNNCTSACSTVDADPADGGKQ